MNILYPIKNFIHHPIKNFIHYPIRNFIHYPIRNFIHYPIPIRNFHRSILILFSVFSLITLSLSGCTGSGSKTPSSEQTTSSVPVSSESAPASSEPETPEATETTEPSTQEPTAESDSEKAPTTVVGHLGDEFLLPDAQTHLYTYAELSKLSKEELRFARNEIYARHGRIFSDDALQSYFSKKEWYLPQTESTDFDDTVFNETERQNIRLLLSLENESTPLSYPQIPIDEFPMVDGSTATLPISQAIYRLTTGASQKEAEKAICHYKTSASYQNLQFGKRQKGYPSLVIAYAPDEADFANLINPVTSDATPLIIKPIGKDALVFMANEKNPVRSLSQKQIVDIYTGGITNWKTVGGTNQHIEAFQRPESSGSQNLMKKLVMKDATMAEAPTTHIFSEMGEILDALSEYDNSKNAIGYSVYYYAKNMYEKPSLRFMPIDTVLPSNETIRDGSYPYVSDFYAAIRADEPADSYAHQIFDWLTSDDGQALLNGLGYVGISPSLRTLPESIADLTVTTQSTSSTGASIPIRDGYVLIGDGRSLFGESGTVFFDEKLQEQQFLSNMETQDQSLLALQKEEEPLLLCDMRSMLWGAYSIKNNAWILDPVYMTLEQNENGFFGERLKGANQSPDALPGSYLFYEANSANYTYDYANLSGTIVTSGSYDEAHASFIKNIKEKRIAYDEETFATYFPEILSQHQVTQDSLDIWYPYSEGRDTAFLIQKGNIWHVYATDGHFLLSFDETELRKDFSQTMLDTEDFLFYVQPPERPTDSIAVLTVYSDTGSVSRVYENGTEILQISTKDIGTYISCVGDGFYTTSSGNYLSVYNFKHQLCRTFLEGWSRTD